MRVVKGIRVFTLGIDQAVNEGFLRRLAELGQGGGSCELVESEDRLDAVMDAIHRRIGTPVVTEVCLEPAHRASTSLADTLVPDRPPSLFAGSPLLLMGRYRGRPRGPVELRGTTRRRPGMARGDRPERSRQSGDRRRHGHAARCASSRTAMPPGVGDHSALEQTIIATSLRFGVLCRFTAYVAVDRAAVVNEGGEVHQITQPVEMPAGWRRRGLACTACHAAPPSTVQDWRSHCSRR